MPYKDRTAQREAQLRSYHKNKDKWKNKERKSKQDRLRRLDKIAKVVEVKEKTACADCGINYPHYVMDFDHCKGNKIGPVSRLVHTGCSWELIKREIDKCDIVCSNCHRIRTHKR